MKRIFTLIALFYIGGLCAQDQTVKGLQADASKKISKVEDTTNRIWKTGGLVSVNLSQASLTNWAAGGDDFSLAVTSYLNGYANYKKGKHSWDNNLDVNFGYMNTTSLGTRKNDDRFDLTSKYGHELNPKLNLAGLFNFRSQMFKGYNYAADNSSRTLSSAFLSPAYLLVSLGLDYHPVKNLSIFVSPITTRWTIVKNDSLSMQGLYGVDSGKHVRNEIGAYTSVNYETQITKTLNYKGKLELFSNYKHNPANVDIFMTNLFAVKISKVISATWSLDLIYDDDARLFGPNKTSAALQVKSVIGAGLLLKLRN